MRLLAVIAILLSAAAAPAFAQTGPGGFQLAQARDWPDIATPLPRARRAALQDLAGVMGAVHYHVIACEGRGNQYWRQRMVTLLDAEATEDRYLRSAMIQAFNDQYRERERRYPQCSAEAREDRRAMAARGAALVDSLS